MDIPLNLQGELQNHNVRNVFTNPSLYKRFSSDIVKCHSCVHFHWEKKKSDLVFPLWAEYRLY